MIHRFQSIESQVDEFKIATDGSVMVPNIIYHVICAIGITGDYLERTTALFEAGCRVFCMDTSNGFSVREHDAIREFNHRFGYDAKLIAGNVADEVGYQYLAELNVDAVRVGVAGGSVCNTKQESGVYFPMASAISNCYSKKLELQTANKNAPLIIADGGVKTPGDFSVAIGLGADFVLAGGIFSGTDESPGRVIKNETTGELYKTYRGAASYGVQREHTGNKPEYNEGAETLVKYKGSVQDILQRFRNGLRSGMSYMDARTLSEFRQNVSFVEIS
jgi:IMP dehydrogenase